MSRTRKQVLSDLYDILNAAVFMEETRWLNPSTNKIEIRYYEVHVLREEMIKAFDDEKHPIDNIIKLVNSVNDRFQRYDSPQRIKALVDELIGICPCVTPNEVHDTRTPS